MRIAPAEVGLYRADHLRCHAKFNRKLLWRETAGSDLCYRSNSKFGVSASLSLLSKSTPAAIARLVVAIVIRITIKGFTLRTLPHVGEEILKLVPPLADFNTSTSITGIAGGRLAIASRQHSLPCLVCPSRGVILGMTMRAFGATGVRTLDAPATTGMASFQMAGSDDAHRPAIAATVPMRVGAARECIFNRYQGAKAAAGNIVRFLHSKNIALPCLYGWFRNRIALA